MAKKIPAAKKASPKKADTKKTGTKKTGTKKTDIKKTGTKKTGTKKTGTKKAAVQNLLPKTLVAKKLASNKRVAKQVAKVLARVPLPPSTGVGADVLDRLWGVVLSRRDADPSVSHSARLLARGTTKVAQKFGEEAVECVIEAITGNRVALIAESADVLYHLLVMWVNAGVRADEVWAELARREGVSGIVEKASRVQSLAVHTVAQTSKVP
jgi:phosphoribosyl-ATP pyrophosphohydrolase